MQIKIGLSWYTITDCVVWEISRCPEYWKERSNECKQSPIIPNVSYHVTVYDLLISGF